MDDQNDIVRVEAKLQEPEVNRPIRLLQMFEVYQSSAEKGVASFILLLRDSGGEKYATTLICRGNYVEHVKKAFGRLLGVPLPVDEANPKDPPEVVGEVEGGSE
jgi:hypothetical protein